MSPTEQQLKDAVANKLDPRTAHPERKADVVVPLDDINNMMRDRQDLMPQESDTYNIKSIVPVEDEMSVDLYALYQKEQSPKFSLLPSPQVDRTKRFKERASNRFKILDTVVNEQFDNNIKRQEELMDVNQLNLAQQKAVSAASAANRATLVDLAMEGADDNLIQMSHQHMEQELTRLQDYVMELKAVQSLSEFGERNPDWADFATENRDLYDTHIKNLQRDMVIKSFIDRKMIENEDPSVLDSFGEFYDDTKELVASVFFDEAFAFFTNNFGETKATRLKREAEKIRDLPVEEIPDALENYWATLLDYSSVYVEDNETAFADLKASFGARHERQEIAAFDTLEMATFLLPIFSGTTVKLFKETGNVEVLAKDAAKALTTGESDVYEDTIEAFIDSVPVKVGDGSGVYTHHSVSEELDKISSALNDATVLPTPQRITSEEAATAFEKTVNNLRIKNDVANLGIFYDDVKGVFMAAMQIGKVSGGGYASEKAAQAAMKKIGIKGEVVSTDKGFVINASMPMQESFADQGFKNFKTRHPIVSFLQGPKAYVDRFIGTMGTASAFKEARISGVAKDIYNKHIDKLSKGEKSGLADVWEYGYENERWLNPEELATQYKLSTGEDITAAAEAAYYASVKLSDFSWFIQNRAVYQDKVARGYVKVSIDNVMDEGFNGKILSKDSQITREKLIYDVEKRQAYPATREKLDELKERGLSIVEPEDASWTIKEFGEPASYIATNNKSLKVSDIDFDQIGRVQGGRRVYQSPFFIGQQNHIRTSGGTRFLGSPKVFRTADNINDAKKYVDNLNAMFKDVEEYKAGLRKLENHPTMKADVKAAKIEASHKYIRDKFLKTHKRVYDDFVREVEEEGWDTSVTVQIKRDREDFEPLDYEGRASVKLYDPQSISPAFGVPKRNRLSSRGERLKNINEEDAMILDFQSALRESMDQAIKFGAYNDFKITALNRFATTFGPYVDGFERMSPYEMVVRGQPLESLAKSTDPLNREIYRAFKAHQFYIKSILRVRTKWDEQVEGFMNSLAQSIENVGEKIGGKVGAKAKNISTSLYKAGNPIEKIRSLNYDLNLGMFNPAQFILQAQSAVTALSLSPKFGMQAFKDMVPLRYALIAQDDATTAAINKMIRKGGKDIDEFSDMEKSAAQINRIGFNNFGSNLAMIDAQTTMGSYANPYMNKISRFRESGRIFFQEGERVGRLVAYGIAKRKYAEKFGEDVYTTKADNWIREEADRLLLSPNSDNNQMFTKGALSLPTQFWSYMGKMADVMLTGANGRYTAAERAKLVGSQVVFYGAAGMPFLDWAVNNAVNSTNEPLDPEVVKFMHNGIIDGLIFVASDGEINTDLSSSAGFGGFVKSMVRNFSERPIGNILGGASGGNMSRAIEKAIAVAELNGAFVNPDPVNVTEAGIQGVLSMVKSLDRASQAFMAYSTGTWYDKHYRPMFKMNKAEALAYLAGFNPADRSAVYDLLSGNKETSDKFVADISRNLQGLYEKWNLAETDKEKQHIKETIQAYGSILRESGYGAEAINRFLSFQRNDTFLDSLSNKAAEDERYGRNLNRMVLTPEQREQLRGENN